MKISLKTLLASLLVVVSSSPMWAQTLTLEQCRQMAIENNRDLQQARTKVEMAGYDKKSALANYFPKVSATGMYLHNTRDISIISDDMSAALTNAGTTVQGSISSTMQTLMGAITSNPAAAMEYMKSPMWQTVMGALSQTDLSQAINALGTEIDNALHPDFSNVYAGVVSLQQPLFMGGKIIAANKVAGLAEQLSKTQYEQQYQQIIVDVDQAYWQIVSIAAKKNLAEAYADLLHQMQKDVAAAVAEGIATESDALTIKVKTNEADMLLTKSINGLGLAKMLLCKEIGLDLSSEITLADENLDAVPVPQFGSDKSLEEIYEDRSEIKSLDLASRIYEGKVAIARADMLPTVALTANYLLSNPSAFNGITKDWGGMFNVGVMVNVPIFHGFEAVQKTRKAKAEASLYRSQLEGAKDLVNLQVTQLRKQQSEVLEKVAMAENNLSAAEENLRTATIGFENGVIDASVALAAQTAWLQAHSEYIDAGIELQMTFSNLQKAEGNFKSDIQ